MLADLGDTSRQPLMVQKKLLLSLSEFLSLQVSLQLITLLIYTGMIVHSGVALFGEFVFFQALISILAMLFGYRQDIRLLIAQNISSHSVLSNPRILITLVISTFVFGMTLVGYQLDLPITFEMLVLIVTGTVLALQESCLSVLFQARKVVLCFFIRLVAPCFTLLLLVIFDVNAPLYLAATPLLISFAVACGATFMLNNNRESTSLFSRLEYFDRLASILKEDFYPLMAAICVLLSLNLPLVLTRVLFGHEESGLVAVLMKFLGSPLALMLTSVVLLFIRDGIKFEKLKFFNKTFARKYVWAVLFALVAILFLSILAFSIGANYKYFVYLCLALVVLSHALWHSLQAYLQTIGLGSVLARVALIELFVLLFYYLLLPKSSLVLFSFFYGCLAAGLTVLLVFQVCRNRSS